MNNVQLMGRLTTDVEFTKGTKQKKGYAKFTLAVPRGKDDADFINCVEFDKTGEIISQYVKKGNRLIVEGSLNIRSYDDKDGNKQYSTTVIVNRINFVDYKSSEDDEQQEMPF